MPPSTSPSRAASCVERGAKRAATSARVAAAEICASGASGKGLRCTNCRQEDRPWTTVANQESQRLRAAMHSGVASAPAARARASAVIALDMSAACSALPLKLASKRLARQAKGSVCRAAQHCAPLLNLTAFASMSKTAPALELRYSTRDVAALRTAKTVAWLWRRMSLSEGTGGGLPTCDAAPGGADIDAYTPGRAAVRNAGAATAHHADQPATALLSYSSLDSSLLLRPRAPPLQS